MKELIEHEIQGKPHIDCQRQQQTHEEWAAPQIEPASEPDTRPAGPEPLALNSDALTRHALRGLGSNKSLAESLSHGLNSEGK
ncbi:hypothetical protein ACQCSX_08770 [Pseudarthrobacter sp. P1]|uniref:hypothetical protein n=1 Tax=Pseudarthrobacter sp. P1 TaxID=3418418 RepID=UPI003CF9DDEB